LGPGHQVEASNSFILAGAVAVIVGAVSGEFFFDLITPCPLLFGVCFHDSLVARQLSALTG
jgi:hypothetical protein